MGVLIQGSVGQDVRNLQVALNYHMPFSVPGLIVDGIFGAKTKARTTEFQLRFGLKSDGIVGPKTHAALYSFVDCSHHLLSVTQPSDIQRFSAGQNLSAIGDSPSQASNLPPMPRLQLPFPSALPPVPGILQPPRLELDPKILFLLQKTKWEIEAGKETTFQKNLTTDKSQREVALVAEATGTVWTKPLGENFQFSAGGGVAVEQRVRPDPQTEVSVFVFAKVETRNILKLGPVDILKLTAEAKLGGKLGKNEPPDFSVAVGGGPEVEVLDGKVTFGPGAYFQYQPGPNGHVISGQVSMTGTFHF